MTAVVGTHTHVPTADARVLPGGTAYITDVGMTGAARRRDRRRQREQAIESLRTQMPCASRPPTRTRGSCGVLSAARQPRRADAIEQVLLPGADRRRPRRRSSATSTSGKNQTM